MLPESMLYNSERHNGRNCDEVQFKTKLLPDPAVSAQQKHFVHW